MGSHSDFHIPYDLWEDFGGLLECPFCGQNHFKFSPIVTQDRKNGPNFVLEVISLRGCVARLEYDLETKNGHIIFYNPGLASDLRLEGTYERRN